MRKLLIILPLLVLLSGCGSTKQLIEVYNKSVDSLTNDVQSGVNELADMATSMNAGMESAK